MSEADSVIHSLLGAGRGNVQKIEPTDGTATKIRGRVIATHLYITMDFINK